MVRKIWENGMKCRRIPIFEEGAANDDTYAAFYGRLRALFGEPNASSTDLSDMYLYDIRATAEDGRVLYMIIAHSGVPIVTLPADGEGTDLRPYKAARTELIMRIMCTKPADYECFGFSEDNSRKITYKVKNGIVSSKQESAKNAI